MNNLKISIIMNCYNSDTFLKESIDSVIGQTYENWEIIFWDNQSTDKSASIVKSYDDPRITYFYADKHTVLGEARNLALEKAGGDWVAFLDCDDIWYSQKLEKQIDVIRKEKDINSLGMVYCGADTIDEKSDVTGQLSNFKYPNGNIFLLSLKINVIPWLTVLMQKSFLDSSPFPWHYKHCEDYYVICNIAKKARVKAVEEYLCAYRQHANNLSHAQIHNYWVEVMDMISIYGKSKFHKLRLKCIWNKRFFDSGLFEKIETNDTVVDFLYKIYSKKYTYSIKTYVVCFLKMIKSFLERLIRFITLSHEQKNIKIKEKCDIFIRMFKK